MRDNRDGYREQRLVLVLAPKVPVASSETVCTAECELVLQKYDCEMPLKSAHLRKIDWKNALNQAADER